MAAFMVVLRNLFKFAPENQVIKRFVTSLIVIMFLTFNIIISL